MSGSCGSVPRWRDEGGRQALLTPQQAAELLGQLTAKQVQVVDLLVGHLTTKEIARELNLAPNTVDQRITAAREKWGLPNRKALVRQYTELQEICGKTTYEPALVDEDIAEGNRPEDPQASEDQASEEVTLGHTLRPGVSSVGPQDARRSDNRFMLQSSDIRFGRLGRVGLALIFALMIALTLAATLVIAETMARWL